MNKNGPTFIQCGHKSNPYKSKKTSIPSNGNTQKDSQLPNKDEHPAENLLQKKNCKILHKYTMILHLFCDPTVFRFPPHPKSPFQVLREPTV